MKDCPMQLTFSFHPCKAVVADFQGGFTRGFHSPFFKDQPIQFFSAAVLSRIYMRTRKGGRRGLGKTEERRLQAMLTELHQG